MLAFSSCVTLEQDRQSVLILRHERGLPASPASLVEKIGESIFVLVGVSRELDHHCLVFFHRELDYEPVTNNRLEQGIPGQE